MRVEKKFLQNWAYRVSKKAEFFADFKHVQKSQVWQKGKNFLQKNRIMQYIVFLRKNLWEPLDAKVAEFLYPLRPILKKFFFNSYMGRCSFFRRIKGQIR
jgi:hypothetical protein